MSITEYKRDGYLISEEILNNDQILSLRKELDNEFKNHNNVIKYLHQFENKDLIKKIISLYSHKSIKKIEDELINISKTDVSVLPEFMVHRNYHVDTREKLGWHRDCGGELKYDYCNKIIANNNYLFSKVAFYLQENNEYGGSIDVIKTSHKNFGKTEIILRKIKNIPLRAISFFHKYFSKLYNLLPESIFMFLLNAKRLCPNIGTAVFFSSKLIHRGSPISKKKYNEVFFEKGKYQAHTSDKVTKYTIYCHFGTTQAVDSYFFDRLKRENSIDELKNWISQIKHISKYDDTLSTKISSIIEPIKKKYSNYI